MKRVIQKIGYVLYSIRPSACLMVGIFVMVAFRPLSHEMAVAVKLFIAAFAGSAFCFLINDIYDRKKDQLNNKKRPISDGRLTVFEAYLGAFFFVAVYLVSSFLLGKVVFGLAWLSIFFFVIYSPANSKGGVIANVIVAICASGSVWGVAIVRDFDITLFYISGLIFLMILVREVLLDWLDMEGDKAIGKPSIPLLLGTKGALTFIVIFLFIASAFVGLIPVLTSIRTLAMLFLVLSILASWIPTIRLLRKRTDQEVLFSIRFSHVTFVFVVLGILFR